MPLLIEEVAYEQWHHMLFARFLAENDLLIHPEHRVPVSLGEVDELAREEGESDHWLLAARYAERMLPGIFRTDDPSAQVRFAPDQRQALERLLAELPPEVFTADDALGWVYQFWQTKRKKEVNASGRKIGGADIAPVTQLFTEPYMVRFLLENSLGAWWVSRHPESPLREQWEYLRFRDDGTPAAGTFEGWPETAAEVSVMDPCCGSGHFLVVAADMLRQMRMEEEGLSEAEAGDAVLRDNLFGLELDPRCTQIAAFAVAFDAWRHGGYRELPVPNIACSGIAVRGQLENWTRLAGGDPNLVHALTRLYELFKDAPDLGSLIDPTALSTGGMFDVDPDTLLPLLEKALAKETDDPAAAVFGAAAEGAAKAARLLAGKYWLVATNPPFLGRNKFGPATHAVTERSFGPARHELAGAFQLRALAMSAAGGSTALVLPQNLLYQSRSRSLRDLLLREGAFSLAAGLGSGAFSSISGEVVTACLVILASSSGNPDHSYGVIAEGTRGTGKIEQLQRGRVEPRSTKAVLADRDRLILAPDVGASPRLEDFAISAQGLATSDDAQFTRSFFEFAVIPVGWDRLQGPVAGSMLWGGCDLLLCWEDGRGRYRDYAMRLKAAGRLGGWRSGASAWGKEGALVSRIGMWATGYSGAKFPSSAIAVVPRDPVNRAAIRAFVGSGEFRAAVRSMDPKLAVTNTALTKVPFDLEHWTKVADEQYPNGLPEPHSDDPTQWLFKGHPKGLRGSAAGGGGAPARLSLARPGGR